MDYIIETDFEGPNFVMVPNSVAQSGNLSAEALGVLVYMASLPRGFLLRVVSVREVFGMGKDKWQRIARELRSVGAMDVQTVRGAGGRAVGRRVSVRWPDFTESRKNQPSDRKPEKPAVGKPAKQGRKTRQTGPEKPAPYKEQIKINSGGAQTERAALTEKAKAKPKGGQACAVSFSELSDLSNYQRKCLREGSTVLVGGKLLRPDTAAYVAAKDALEKSEFAKAVL